MHKIVSATRSPACAALVALASAAVILITVVLAASAQATAPAAAADPGQVRILRFIDRVDESANTDIDLGATGPSAGDQQVFRDILLRNGRRIGTASGVAQVVARDATTLTAQVVSTQTLPGGTLTLQTAFTEVLAQGPPAFRWAITGGTGAYRGARGECRSTFVNDHDDAAVTCTILLGP